MESGAFCLIIFRIVQAVVAIVVLSTALFYVLKTQWITNSGNFMVFNVCTYVGWITRGLKAGS